MLLRLLTVVLSTASVIHGHTPILGDFFGRSGQNATFDYVVVGGGTAGLALASRLSENKDISVAVVEAGSFYELTNGNISTVPGLDINYDQSTQASQWSSPSVDWGFLTTPQAGCDNLTLHYARGKTLGGSSALNSMMYNRGTVGAYDKWANLTGDDSYKFNNFLPYFSRYTNFTGAGRLRNANASVPSPEPQSVDPQGKPLHVSYPNFALPISSWMEKVFTATGLSSIASLLDGKLIGHQYIPMMIDPTRATRDSSETSFLRSAISAGRTNLVTYTSTMAEKIMFNGTRATSVRISQHPSAPPFYLNARREVILSAGAVQSPQLLQVSGIGPRALLQKHNISVHVDSPGVGQNLWEHFNVAYFHQTNIAEGINTFLYNGNATYAAQTVQEYYERQSGVLSNANTDYTGWTKLPEKYRAALGDGAKQLDETFPADWPELEIEVSAGTLTPTAVNNLLLVAVLVAPLSRGNVSIASPSMRDPPLLDLGLLSDPTDQKMVVQALRFMRDLVAEPVLQPVLMGDELSPGANLTTDEQLLDYYKKNPSINWHAACTCAMGKDGHEMAVLDSRARVRGVQGLRVVDASSFPVLPPGHPVASIYALAEKIAEDILNTTTAAS